MEHQSPTKKKSTCVYPLEIIERIRQLAAEHGRALNGEIIWALRHCGTAAVQCTARPTQQREVAMSDMSDMSDMSEPRVRKT
jgi:hypothetical protein